MRLYYSFPTLIKRRTNQRDPNAEYLLFEFRQEPFRRRASWDKRERKNLVLRCCYLVVSEKNHRRHHDGTLDEIDSQREVVNAEEDCCCDPNHPIRDSQDPNLQELY
ncbi:hypothetical protein V8G54_024340 [Vigna mungo]|uniref:Uncharacterized protein n=1 Tax=Vigna mungo TaxID=3915 RepID=A0AAQ3RQ15_VIGMU